MIRCSGLALVCASFALAATCDSLGSLNFPNTTISLAQQVAAKEFRPPDGSSAQPFGNLPAFCRVAATLKPTTDSDIRIEVWMPASGWNGKLVAVGNGGWSGAINYGFMAQMLSRGYATASTDTGHEGGEAKFAMGHPEKLIDFAYRSEHELSLKAKAVVAAFYGNAAQRSYWFGCSSGGKQGLMEAQRYPRDYDGI